MKRMLLGLGSGTLVSPTKVLTAAHNVDLNFNGNVTDPGDINFLLGADVETSPTAILAVASVEVHPFWQSSNGLAQYDLAVLTLTTPYTGVAPMSLSLVDPIGMTGTMIGYGGHGNGEPVFDYSFDGQRRAAQNTLDFVDVDVEHGLTIITDFDAPEDWTSLNGSTNYLGFSTPFALEGTTAGGGQRGPAGCKS